MDGLGCVLGRCSLQLGVSLHVWCLFLDLLQQCGSRGVQQTSIQAPPVGNGAPCSVLVQLNEGLYCSAAGFWRLHCEVRVLLGSHQFLLGLATTFLFVLDGWA